MATNEEKIRQFRDEFRLALIEQLVLKHALVGPVLSGHLSVVESREVLNTWLDKHSREADAHYGEILKDPALCALHADELKLVTDKMKEIVDTIADDLKQKFPKPNWP